jgi:hypothetical protein
VAEKPFDPLTPQQRDQLAQGSAETETIKRQIERTRSEMSETLGEIQDRLRPDHLLQQARDGVTQAAAGKMRTMMSSASETASTMATQARGAGNYMADYATEHPIRIAITVGALTWWMLRGRSGADEWYGASDTSWDDAEAMEPGNGRSLRDRAGEYASGARDTVSEYASGARETVSEYASSARDAVGGYATSARESARAAAMRARSAAGSAAGTVDDWVTANPMAAGAMALIAGMAIGLSAPRTELEDGALGAARDRAMERASQVAQNLKENVTDKVASAAENLVSDSIRNAPATSPSDGRA